ncbi:LppM family (lipo)protein [Brachybacterium huguangmaarense]
MHPTTWGRRALAVLILPIALLLAACSFDATYKVKDVDTIDLSMKVGVTSAEASQLGITSAQNLCDQLMSSSSDSGEDVDAEPSDEGDGYSCTVSGTITRADFGSDITLTEDNGEYHLVMGGSDFSDLGSSDAAGMSISMTFEFPGKVTESKAGQIDGNKVVYTSASELAQGVDIRAKTDGAGAIGWIIGILVILALLAVLVIGAIILFVVLRRRKRSGAGGSVPGGYGSSAPGGYGSSAPGGYGSGAGAYPGAPSAPGASSGTDIPVGPGMASGPGAQGASYAQGQGSTAVPPAPGGYGSPAPQQQSFGSPAPAPGYGSPSPAPQQPSFGSPAPAPGYGSPSPAPSQEAPSYGSPAPQQPSAPEAPQQWSAPAQPSSDQPQQPPRQPWDRPE